MKKNATFVDVDGLQLKFEFKISLYNCKSLNELKEKYELFQRATENEKMNTERRNNNKKCKNV